MHVRTSLRDAGCPASHQHPTKQATLSLLPATNALEIWTRVPKGRKGPGNTDHKTQTKAQMSQNAELRHLSASKLSAPVTGGHLTCNPVIDLTATAGDGGNVLYVWRANDQLVGKHVERNQKVEAIKWKEDGMSLPPFCSLARLTHSAQDSSWQPVGATAL